MKSRNDRILQNKETISIKLSQYSVAGIHTKMFIDDVLCCLKTVNQGSRESSWVGLEMDDREGHV